MDPVPCVSCVSFWHWMNAAENHETVHWESGMRYQVKGLQRGSDGRPLMRMATMTHTRIAAAWRYLAPRSHQVQATRAHAEISDRRAGGALSVDLRDRPTRHILGLPRDAARQVRPRPGPVTAPPSQADPTIRAAAARAFAKPLPRWAEPPARGRSSLFHKPPVLAAEVQKLIGLGARRRDANGQRAHQPRRTP
jgi:hypothetical protein